MKVIGLTGGIATGKSTASRTLRQLGATIWDADETARQVVRPGEPGFDRAGGQPCYFTDLFDTGFHFLPSFLYVNYKIFT